MTWEELRDKIDQMTPAERKQPVRFYESYDEDPAVIECELHRADQDIIGLDTATDPTQVKRDVAIPAGEPYLA